ncbi:MAG: NDP-sugar synthase [Methanomassiliicoccales archaeon]|jgi:mannose-1-phosphate guanylyltransferase|nr:NDP-sugar synthase [Methanomassiliicoccales archaeon]
MIHGVKTAVVLAGGEGTRLRPLTNHRPKPLLPVLGRPCVEYTLRALAAAGIEQAYLACGYKSMDVVKALGDGSSLGIDIVYAFEEQPMGTAGAVKLLEKKLPETFVVAMGDVLMDIDFEHIIRFHTSAGAMVTIALTEVDRPEQFGIVGIEENGRISRFKEKPRTEDVFSNLINAGIYVIQKEAFARVPQDTKFDFSKNLFPKLMEEGQPLFGLRLRGMWHDIGQPRDLLNANLGMAERKGVERHIFGTDVQGKVCGSKFFAKGAKLRGPIYLGEEARVGEGTLVSRSAIGQESVVEGGAEIVDSLLLSSCLVRKGAVVQSSIVGDGCLVGEGVTLKDCVLGDNVVLREPGLVEGRTLE